MSDLAPQIVPPPPADLASIEDTPWFLRPTWWPMAVLLPTFLLGLAGLMAAGALPRESHRTSVVGLGFVVLPAGAFLYVGLLALVSERWFPKVRLGLAGLSAAVTGIGALMWFGGGFLAYEPPGRFAFMYFDAGEKAALLALMLGFGWAAILIVLVAGLAIAGRIKTKRAETQARLGAEG